MALLEEVQASTGWQSAIDTHQCIGMRIPSPSLTPFPYHMYWLVFCVNFTEAGVITEKGASLEEMLP